jgi:hypothetical protein
MGFALWVDGDCVWAQGTHEYKPMGAAVIAATDLFRQKDFVSDRRCPARLDRSFVGLFASLGDANHYLRNSRKQKRARLTAPYLLRK